MLEQDIMYILENHKIIRDNCLNCDPEHLKAILSQAGRPNAPIYEEKLRWSVYNTPTDETKES